MLNRDNLIYLLAGAGLTYAFVCWQDKRRHIQRKRLRAMHGPHGHPTPSAFPSDRGPIHPRQRGLALPGPQQPTHPSVQVAGPLQAMPQQAGPPPAGPGAPPADNHMNDFFEMQSQPPQAMPQQSGPPQQFVPDSHDIVQAPVSPHVQAYQAPAPPPAAVMPMSQDTWEVAPGTGPCELQGF